MQLRSFELNLIQLHLILSFLSSIRQITLSYFVEETNQFARDTQQDDWLNEMIHIDCKTFCNSKRGKELNYSCGRTRSHVWLHKDDERILMIYADKDLDN